MRILVAFVKFKDALSAREACLAAAEALAGHRDRTVDLCPMTDGGDGFREVLASASQGTTRQVAVTGPRGQRIPAGLGMVRYGDLRPAALRLLGVDHESPARGPDDRCLAIVEMAEASGLALLSPEERNPWQTTTRGTGDLLAAAAACRADRILLGVGGSATNDLGIGALAALGVRCIDESGTLLGAASPQAWSSIVGLDGKPPTDLPHIVIACDVDNPLLGARGATATFGPQKGLAPEDLHRMEDAAERMARMLCEHFGQPLDLMERPGAGAAGGIAFGLMAAAGATLTSGSALVASWLDLDARTKAADIVITGEGRFDAASLEGKGPGAIATRAVALGKPAHVFAGKVSLPPERLQNSGIAAHAITPEGVPLADALRRTRAMLLSSIREVSASF